MEEKKYPLELTLDQLRTLVEKDDNYAEICLDCKTVYQPKKVCDGCGSEYDDWNDDQCSKCEKDWDWDNQLYSKCPTCNSSSSLWILQRFIHAKTLSDNNITEDDIAAGLIKILHQKYPNQSFVSITTNITNT